MQRSANFVHHDLRRGYLRSLEGRRRPRGLSMEIPCLLVPVAGCVMGICSTRVFSTTPRLGPATSAHFARSATRRRLTFLRATIVKDGRLLMSRPIASPARTLVVAAIDYRMNKFTSLHLHLFRPPAPCRQELGIAPCHLRTGPHSIGGHHGRN
jgi:hypothetical protein